MLQRFPLLLSHFASGQGAVKILQQRKMAVSQKACKTAIQQIDYNVPAIGISGKSNTEFVILEKQGCLIALNRTIHPAYLIA